MYFGLANSYRAHFMGMANLHGYQPQNRVGACPRQGVKPTPTFSAVGRILKKPPEIGRFWNCIFRELRVEELHVPRTVFLLGGLVDCVDYLIEGVAWFVRERRAVGVVEFQRAERCG